MTVGYLLQSDIEISFGDGDLHPDQLRTGLDPARGSQVGPEGAELVFVYFDSALVAWSQVYEWSGRGSKQDKVDTDRVHQVEDVDHAVVLLDEEHQVAQDEEDQSYCTELGSVHKSSSGRDGEYSDDERSDEQPEKPPT